MKSASETQLIDLEDARLSDADEQLLLRSTTLHDIYLAKCKDIKQHSSAVLEKRWVDVTLQKCSIDVADFSDSGIGEEAMKVIAKVLKNNKQLKTLNLHGNNLERGKRYLSISE
jgi:hypothetical protein